MAIFAVVAAAGIIGTVAVVFLATAESADAWHVIFASKKECTTFFKAGGNTSVQANFVCQKLIPHE
jgi:hypothetical protein